MLIQAFRRGFHHESLAASLKRHTVPELKSIAIQSGVNVTGTKPEVINRLVDCFEQSQKQQTRSVLSFDLGYRNLAYCHLDRDANIIDWARIDLNLTSFHPSAIAPVVRTLVQTHLSDPLKAADKVLIEQQRARTGGSHNVLEATMRVNCVEAILWTSLYDAIDQLNRAKQIEMLPILRQRVDRLWQTELDRVTAENVETFSKAKSNYYLKKQASSLLVQNWLDTNTMVNCNESFRAMYEQEKKKDDLSDCLMQALAWFRWEKYTKETCSLYLEKE
ncbi:Cruciform cutting endonuclease 1, mitochondrial [Choanephora cucurbitarum]|uniref:Cruciform cutting endonuclease 1, mitochondrial n=1 Tax=Choanephora cucurbitarum TaxID=101091 RepID=A0A1C7NVM7_9FUNG|nr:Cruciform cutting endonuclease 1, mitochondrial [Choanephora cucurbitarum]